jgi:hypothetical protein
MRKVTMFFIYISYTCGECTKPVLFTYVCTFINIVHLKTVNKASE